MLKTYTVEYLETTRRAKTGFVKARSQEEAEEKAEETYGGDYRDDGMGLGFGSEICKVEKEEE